MPCLSPSSRRSASASSCRAAALYEEALALARELGGKWNVALALRNLGWLVQVKGDFGRAAALSEESLALFRELGDKWGIVTALVTLGEVAQAQGEYGRAAALIEESLQLSHEIGARDLLAETLEGLVRAAAAAGQGPRAARLGGAAEALREALGTLLDPALRAGHERAVEAMRVALGEEGFAAAWAEGRALSLEAAVALALKGHAESSGGE
jgi:tetratricopeptide (TPR) repeat protein